MKHWFVLLTAAAALATAAPTASNAQIAVEVPGVGVRIGEPPRHERERERVFEERDVRGKPECRTVSVTEDTPSGTRTVTRQKCD
jgi:hypothetical protein